MAILGIGKKKEDKTKQVADAIERNAASTSVAKRTANPMLPPPPPPPRRSKQEIDEDVSEGMKQSPPYSDEVMLRLVNLIYDPLATILFREAGMHADEAHLLSLTRVNSSKEAWYWAQQIAKEAAYNKYVQKIPCNWPISQVQRIAFLLARRSIPGTCGPGFMLGVGLAQEQNITKSEEPGESDVL